MLHDNRRISHQRPEIIRSYSGISLEMIEKGFRIGVIIRIYQPCKSPAKRKRKSIKTIHDCFTQSNFFQAPFLCLLRLLDPLTFEPPASAFGNRNAATAVVPWFPFSVRREPS